MNIKCKNRPLFYQCLGQHQPQNAYLYIYADNSFEFAPTQQPHGSMAKDVFEKRTLAFEIDERFTSAELETVKVETAPIIKILIDNSKIELVEKRQRYERVLNEIAKDAESKIIDYFRNNFSNDLKPCDGEYCSYCNDHEKEKV